eukprot:6205718-Pleurochrysis_carterae.AAC.15
MPAALWRYLSVGRSTAPHLAQRAMFMARPRRACRAATDTAGEEADASEIEANVLHVTRSSL